MIQKTVACAPFCPDAGVKAGIGSAECFFVIICIFFVDKGNRKRYNGYIKTGESPEVNEEREKMKIETAKLTNYWEAKSDPDFVDVRVRLGKHFLGGYVLTVFETGRGIENAKFNGAACQISKKAGERLMRKYGAGVGDVIC